MILIFDKFQLKISHLEERFKDMRNSDIRYPSVEIRESDHCDIEWQKADSDYFSTNSSPRWDPVDAYIWDSNNFPPKPENIYGKVNRKLREY